MSLMLIGCSSESIREETGPTQNRIYDEYFDFQADKAFDEWQQEKIEEYRKDRELDFKRIAATEAKGEELAKEAQEAFGDSLERPPEEEGCPIGCFYHEIGCDIKGTISTETKEKIYYIPGQALYNETEINPRFGERWFCTEKEALDNGWRKAKQ